MKNKNKKIPRKFNNYFTIPACLEEPMDGLNNYIDRQKLRDKCDTDNAISIQFHVSESKPFRQQFYLQHFG
jgi:hypothetical protein